MPDNFDGMAVFMAVAETKGFRAAGERLGMSGSAVSQSLRRLEERVGVPLVRRTTRSVRLTDAGQTLYEAARTAFDGLRSAVSTLREQADTPRGTLRLHVAGAAAAFLNAELLTGFLASHPAVQLDVFISDAPCDIVAMGYDAGVRLGEVIDADMIGIPFSGDLQLIVVGAPSYFTQHPMPAHPRDLLQHRCINWHATESEPPYKWEFTENGRDFTVDVQADVLTNDPALNVRLAMAGAGLTLADQHRSREALANGTLVQVLAEFSTPFPGFYLYYPHRSQASPALLALVELLLRQARRR